MNNTCPRCYSTSYTMVEAPLESIYMELCRDCYYELFPPVMTLSFDPTTKELGPYNSEKAVYDPYIRNTKQLERCGWWIRNVQIRKDGVTIYTFELRGETKCSKMAKDYPYPYKMLDCANLFCA